MVQVQALNAEGEAGGTGLKVFQHDRVDDAEGLRPPYDLDATAVSPNSIELSWEGPSDGFFSISCQPLSFDSPIILNRYVDLVTVGARCAIMFFVLQFRALCGYQKPQPLYYLRTRSKNVR